MISNYCHEGQAVVLGRSGERGVRQPPPVCVGYRVDHPQVKIAACRLEQGAHPIVGKAEYVLEVPAWVIWSSVTISLLAWVAKM